MLDKGRYSTCRKLIFFGQNLINIDLISIFDRLNHREFDLSFLPYMTTRRVDERDHTRTREPISIVGIDCTASFSLESHEQDQERLGLFENSGILGVCWFVLVSGCCCHFIWEGFEDQTRNITSEVGPRTHPSPL